MALTKNVNLNKSYSVEELYELIKDYPFTAGKPELTKYGPALFITFPALDSHNQVQIIKGSLFGKKSSKYTVQKAEAAGLKNMAKNDLLDLLTDGFAGARGLVGDTAEICFQLVDITAQELEDSGY